MDWIATHWDELVVAALAVLGAANAIAAMTETKKDDKYIGWLYAAVNKLARRK